MNYSKLGRKRKKKQKYRKARGIHNKIRLKMGGHPRKVEIGYKKAKKGKRKEIKIISNINELLKIKNGEKIILAGVGRKKKIEVARKAKELGVKILNLNIEKFLKKTEKEKIEKVEKARHKEKKEEKKVAENKAGKKENAEQETKKEIKEEKKIAEQMKTEESKQNEGGDKKWN